MKTILLVFFIYTLVILLIFGGLFQTFFQQDEWATFGNVIYFNLTKASWREIILPFGGLQHFFPFSRLAPKLLFDWFGMNFLPYAWISLAFHNLNSFLVFYLSWLLSRKKLIAFLAGLFFALSSLGSQTVIWLGTAIGTQAACLFLLLSLIFFVKNVKNWSLFFLIVSLFFKESAVFLFPYLPFLWLITNQRKDLAKAKKDFLPFAIFAVFYLGLRILILLIGEIPHGTPQELAQPTLKVVYLYRMLVTPLKALTQSLVPTKIIIFFGKALMQLGYPFLEEAKGVPNPFLVESVAADIVSYSFAFLILLISWLVFRFWRSKDKKLARLVPLMLAYIGLASLPLILIPGKAGYFSLIEGRHLYFLNIASCLYLAIIVFTLKTILAKKTWLNKISLAVLILIILLYHGLAIRTEVAKVAAVSQIRIEILEQIYRGYPKLPAKAVFYTESDKAYYGLPPEEKILPFQSGFGQTILIWYFGKGQVRPECFFTPTDDYLYAITEEDYRFCQDYGFGYFRNYSSLKQTIFKNGLSPENVIAWRFNSQNNSLTDITSEIRLKLIRGESENEKKAN